MAVALGRMAAERDLGHGVGAEEVLAADGEGVAARLGLQRAGAGRGGESLSDALAAMPELTAHPDRAAIERLTDPANYLGAAPETVDRVLAGAARGA
jgi:adenylosuccinate lyase